MTSIETLSIDLRLPMSFQRPVKPANGVSRETHSEIDAAANTLSRMRDQETPYISPTAHLIPSTDDEEDYA